MRLLFEVDTEVYHKDHMHLITRAERARLELIEQVEIISPVLVGYLNDFRVSCTHPGHSRPRVDYSISIHTPFAQGSAVFRDLKGQTGFILPQPRQIVDAFLRRNDEVDGEVKFPKSRLGQAFLWNIGAGKRQLKDRGDAMAVLGNLDVFASGIERV
jgi:hypothetical protein